MISFALALIISVVLAASLGLFKFKRWSIYPENATVTQEEYDNNLQWKRGGYDVGDLKPNTSLRFNYSHLFKAIGVLFLFLFLWAVSPLGFQRIDARNIGLQISRTGNDKGIPRVTPVKGLVFYNAWNNDVEEISIGQFPIKYTEFEVPALGGTPIPVAPEMNLSLKPETYAQLYVHVLKGGDLSSLKDSWIRTNVINAMVYATNKFTPDSIFNYAETYRNEVYTQLSKTLGSYFNVDQVNAGQHPPRSMKEALQKQADAVLATRQAQLDETREIAQKNAKIAQAQGDSAKVVIEASAAAEAIRLKTKELSREYVEYTKWITASPDVQRVSQTVLGSGTNVLLNK